MAVVAGVLAPLSWIFLALLACFSYIRSSIRRAPRLPFTLACPSLLPSPRTLPRDPSSLPCPLQSCAAVELSLSRVGVCGFELSQLQIELLSNCELCLVHVGCTWGARRGADSLCGAHQRPARGGWEAERQTKTV